ncbi:MAG: Holliday junction branch migration protein RuvA [Gammaproteobacteria bacterium]|nr:Holliday junction branch migration protein RuvA [Gammaproteobacteria bacterium]MCF6229407.1 Holliday junction branch migration protein RuvA [Gammaproteobacteria bacterium]
MIGRLQGILVAKQAPELLVDVQGVGYEVNAPMSTVYQLPALGEAVVLHTHMVVREDAQLLYGFASLEERTLFRTLIKVNGVGAKLALTILSGIAADDFVRCVRDEDAATLVRLPGIGKKTAERLIIEMRDRFKDWQGGDLESLGNSANPNTRTPSVEDPAKEALSALIALGYKPQEASRLIKSLDTDGKSSEDIIRASLQSSVKK